MKVRNIKPRIQRLAHGVKYFFKKNKNDIIFGCGVVTEIAAVVVSSRAGIKQRDMSDKLARKMDNLVDADNDDDAKKESNANERRVVYRTFVKSTIKNYAIPVALTAGSIGLYSKSHFDLKSQLASTTAALAAEHALNQRLLAERNADNIPEKSDEETQETAVNAPYSGGIPTDVNDFMLNNAVIIYDSESKYFAEKDGYTDPTDIMLSPTCIEWKRAKYSDFTANFDWNIDQIRKIMRDVISRSISLYGFVNLNEIRKHFSEGRSYKLEEAENYYLLFDDNRHQDDQVVYRIYGECDDSGVIKDRVFIDIFNTVVPKPGDLKEAKRHAVAANPLKEY